MPGVELPRKSDAISAARLQTRSDTTSFLILEMDSAEFHAQVYRIVRLIPDGRVTSYVRLGLHIAVLYAQII